MERKADGLSMLKGAERIGIDEDCRVLYVRLDRRFDLNIKSKLLVSFSQETQGNAF